MPVVKKIIGFGFEGRAVLAARRAKSFNAHKNEPGSSHRKRIQKLRSYATLIGAQAVSCQ
jgi:hypothetical protein